MIIISQTKFIYLYISPLPLAIMAELENIRYNQKIKDYDVQHIRLSSK